MVLAKDSWVFIHVIINVAHPLTPISYEIFISIDSHFTVTITVFELSWRIKQSILCVCVCVMFVDNYKFKIVNGLSYAW